MAPRERYFGAEVVDGDFGQPIVTELPAATAFIAGTAPIHEVHDTPEQRAMYINKNVILRRRSDITKHFGPVRDGYTLPQKLDAMFTKARTRGIGTVVAVNVFDPDVHKDENDNPDPSKVTNLDIIGTFDAAGQPSGLKLAYSCYQYFGWFPKMILCSGFDALPGVKAELEVIANRIRARYFLDAAFGATPQTVVEARGPYGSFNFQTNHRRAVLCWPYMTVVNKDDTSPTAGEEIPDHYSAHFAGHWLMSVMEYGYHHSPSNRPLWGIEDSAQEVLYIPGDPTSDAQLLRSNGICSIEERHGKGPHTAGNRSAAFPTTTDMRNFLHVQYIEDVMDEAILHYLDQFKDRNGNRATIEIIEDGANGYGQGLTAGRDPVLSDFRFILDRELTTHLTVGDGWFQWRLDYAPIGIMERLTVHRSIDIRMLANPLGLAAPETRLAA